MERRNTDRNNITSSTQYSNQSQRNYNYQHYSDNNSLIGQRIISIVPTQLNGQWTSGQNGQVYSILVGLISAHTYIVQLFNSDATVKYNNNKIVMRQMLTTSNSSNVYASSVTDYLEYTIDTGTIARLTVAAPKNIDTMRIYMYDITDYTNPPIIDWEGNIVG